MWHRPKENSNREGSLAMDEFMNYKRCELQTSEKKTDNLLNLFINSKRSHGTTSRNANMVAYVNDHCYTKEVTETPIRYTEKYNEVTASEIKNIEIKTRSQRKCSLWKKMRNSRITASNAFDVCASARSKTFSVNLARRMIDSKDISNISSVKWGIEHETTAIQIYSEVSGTAVRKCGFYIDECRNYLGATPDGISTNSDKIVEVKCPSSVPALNVSYLKTKNGDELKLSRTHKYYYQVQIQMHVTKIHVCDFVVWSPTNVYIETIHYDVTFVSSCLELIDQYYKKVFCDTFFRMNTLDSL